MVDANPYSFAWFSTRFLRLRSDARARLTEFHSEGVNPKLFKTRVAVVVYISQASFVRSLAEKAVPSHGFRRSNFLVTKSLRLPTVRFRASSRARRSGSVAASASA